MKYVISADTVESYAIGGLSMFESFVYDNTSRANSKWAELKTNEYFENVSAHTLDEVITRTLTLYQVQQFEKPKFASVSAPLEIERLFNQAYGACVSTGFTLALPRKPFEQMRFDKVDEIDASDSPDGFHKITVVRENLLGTKLIISERFTRFDEMLTGRKDVCQVRLHPYCSDFNLVKEIELGHYDYDM